MSATRKPGYKLSTVGWIPSTWTVKQLGHVTTECKIRNNAKLDDKLLCGVLKSQGLVPMRERVKGASTDRCKVVVPNAFAYNPMRLNIGSIARNKNQHEVMVSPDYVVFATDPLQLLPNYLDQVRRSGLWERYVGASGDGSVRVRIYYEDLARLEIPIPPIPEQQKIAAVLCEVDGKLDIVARQIEATQALKQGLMQTMFSSGVGTQDADGRWVPHTEFKDSELGAIPVGWEVAQLGGLIEKLMDFRGRTPKKLGMEWGGGGISALSANNVRMGYIDFDRECYVGNEELYRAWMVQGDVQKNDLVFTMEAPLGNVAVVPDDRRYILSQRVILLRPNQRITYRFLFQYLRSELFTAILDMNSTGTTAKGIQQKRLVQLPALVPPIDEQERIADVLGEIDAKLTVLSGKRSQYQVLKRGLLQKLLTGEWRVTLNTHQGMAIAA